MITINLSSHEVTSDNLDKILEFIKEHVPGFTFEKFPDENDCGEEEDCCCNANFCCGESAEKNAPENPFNKDPLCENTEMVQNLEKNIILPYLTTVFGDLSAKGVVDMYRAAKWVVHDRTGMIGTTLSKETSKEMIKIFDEMRDDIDTMMLKMEE